MYHHKLIAITCFAMIASFSLTCYSQVPSRAFGNPLLRIERIGLEDNLGPEEPAVRNLEQRIRLDSNLTRNPEIQVAPENTDIRALMDTIKQLQSRLASLESARADEFLLRFETIGYRDRPSTEREPPSEVLESIEIAARVNQPFHGKYSIGASKISIDGFLEQLKDGQIRVRFNYCNSTHTGESIPGPNGIRVPITDSTNVDSTRLVELHKPVELGGISRTTRSPQGAESKTQTQIVMSINEFEPRNN